MAKNMTTGVVRLPRIVLIMLGKKRQVGNEASAVASGELSARTSDGYPSKLSFRSWAVT